MLAASLGFPVSTPSTTTPRPPSRPCNTCNCGWSQLAWVWLTSDADEYLRASIQREDTYNSGKVEYHQGGGYDLGVIWTPTERTLIIATQSDD